MSYNDVQNDVQLSFSPEIFYAYFLCKSKEIQNLELEEEEIFLLEHIDFEINSENTITSIKEHTDKSNDDGESSDKC